VARIRRRRNGLGNGSCNGLGNAGGNGSPSEVSAGGGADKAVTGQVVEIDSLNYDPESYEALVRGKLEKRLT
jgi:hypothetical protein